MPITSLVWPPRGGADKPNPEAATTLCVGADWKPGQPVPGALTEAEVAAVRAGIPASKAKPPERSPTAPASGSGAPKPAFDAEAFLDGQKAGAAAERQRVLALLALAAEVGEPGAATGFIRDGSSVEAAHASLAPQRIAAGWGRFVERTNARIDQQA